MKTAHHETQQLMNNVNSICIRNEWSYQDLANALNEFLTLESGLRFSSTLTAKERVSLNRWRAITSEHWTKVSGDYLLAFNSVRDKYK